MNDEQKALLAGLQELISASPNLISALANVSSELYESLQDINWVGFYLLHEGRLVLGPFCGKPACISIPLGRGVCGNAAAQDQVLRIDDVHTFPGHIACDSASNAEIVIPLHVDHKVVGVLDIDSPSLNRFSEPDEIMLKQLTLIIENSGLLHKSAYTLS